MDPLLDYYSWKPSFMLNRPPDGYNGRSFRRHGGGKNTFLLTSNIQNVFVLSRELVKNWSIKRKMGVTRHLKRVIHQTTTNFLCRNIIYLIICLICLCFSWFCVLQLKKIALNYPGMMKVTCVTCAEKMRRNNSRERPKGFCPFFPCLYMYVLCYKHMGCW